jgi:hypothetical protein
MKIFCVGIFRTGTTTMREMFARSFPADHEFRVEDELSAFAGRISGDVSDDEIRAFVRERGRAKPLVMDSCGAHFGIADILVEEYPDARFLLTMRNVYAWMNSCIGKLYGDFEGGWGSRAGDVMNNLGFLPDGSFAIEDRSGSKICLEQMMKLWTAVNRRVISVVPPERLLVLNTEDLAASTPSIAAFCGIDEDLLDPLHANPGPSADFLRCFDAGRLQELAERHCSELMRERYPGMTLADHSRIERSGPAPDCAEIQKYFSLDQFVPTSWVQTRVPA